MAVFFLKTYVAPSCNIVAVQVVSEAWFTNIVYSIPSGFERRDVLKQLHLRVEARLKQLFNRNEFKLDFP